MELEIEDKHSKCRPEVRPSGLSDPTDTSPPGRGTLIEVSRSQLITGIDEHASFKVMASRVVFGFGVRVAIELHQLSATSALNSFCSL